MPPSTFLKSETCGVDLANFDDIVSLGAPVGTDESMMLDFDAAIADVAAVASLSR